MNTVYRLQHHRSYRNNDPNTNEGVKDIVQFTAIVARGNQCVNFLAERAATVEFLEFFDGWNHDAKQLEDSQQSQKP